jgi:intracellular sulfur oxidation DsrE/DsrF family protein
LRPETDAASLGRAAQRASVPRFIPSRTEALMNQSEHVSDTRRSFLGSMAASALAVAAIPSMASAEPAGLAATEPWLAGVSAAKHRAVVDGLNVNGGWPGIFAGNYVKTMTETYQLAPKTVHAMLVLRHFGASAGFTDAIWSKYNVGAALGIMDPATKAPATRNPFVNSHEGDLMVPAFAIDRLAAAGVTVCVCNVATMALSQMLGTAAGIKPADAYAEWKANLAPGATIVPSGVLALGRAQETGCAFISGG